MFIQYFFTITSVQIALAKLRIRVRTDEFKIVFFFCGGGSNRIKTLRRENY